MVIWEESCEKGYIVYFTGVKGVEKFPGSIREPKEGRAGIIHEETAVGAWVQGEVVPAGR